MAGSQSNPFVRFYDRLERLWDADRTRVLTSRMLLFAFLGSVVWIELARRGIAGSFLGREMPTNHLAAISWVVTLLLIAEILDLIFGLASSVADALGKQLQIFSLVLLRKTLDELPNLGEPVSVVGNLDVVLRMASDAAGALLVFAGTVLYTRLLRHDPISDVPGDVDRFVATKKLVCLGLLVAFIWIAALQGFDSLTVRPEADGGQLDLAFFEVFFTVLIFADVVIVLASLGSTRTHSVIFRNFAFAAVTVFLRLALSAGPYTNSILGVGAALFAVIAVWISNSAVAPAATSARERVGS